MKNNNVLLQEKSLTGILSEHGLLGEQIKEELMLILLNPKTNQVSFLQHLQNIAKNGLR